MKPKLITIAQNLAKTAKHDMFKLAALVFDKQGRVISAGVNHQTKTHPILRRYDLNKTVHAEAAALLFYKHPQHFKGASIFVYRERKDGNFANAKPCHMCQKLIQQFGISKLYYTTETGIVYEPL